MVCVPGLSVLRGELAKSLHLDVCWKLLLNCSAMNCTARSNGLSFFLAPFQDCADRFWDHRRCCVSWFSYLHSWLMSLVGYDMIDTNRGRGLLKGLYDSLNIQLRKQQLWEKTHIVQLEETKFQKRPCTQRHHPRAWQHDQEVSEEI